MHRSNLFPLLMIVLPALCAPNAAGGDSLKKGKTAVATVPAGGPPSTHHASTSPALSVTGRYLLFKTDVDALIGGVANGVGQLVVLDRDTGQQQLATVTKFGAPSTSISTFGALSADGRYVAFTSAATNLVTGLDVIDNLGYNDIFRRDMQTGTTVRVSKSWDNKAASFHCIDPHISADGRFVAFQTISDNLVPGSGNAKIQVFVRDLLLNTIERASKGPGATPADASCDVRGISGDGRFVLYQSYAENLGVPSIGTSQVWLRDRQEESNELISIAKGAAAKGDCYGVALSSDGRYVAFTSDAKNLPGAGKSGKTLLYVRDRKKGKTSKVKFGKGLDFQNDGPTFSANGRYLTVTLKQQGKPRRSYVHDLKKNQTTLVSVNSKKKKANDACQSVVISGNGKIVAWASKATNLGADKDDDFDVFVRRW